MHCLFVEISGANQGLHSTITIKTSCDIISRLYIYPLLPGFYTYSTFDCHFKLKSGWIESMGKRMDWNRTGSELKSNWKMDMWLEWSLSGYGQVYGMKSSVHVSKVES